MRLTKAYDYHCLIGLQKDEIRLQDALHSKCISLIYRIG